MADLADSRSAVATAPIIDDHAILQGWTPINGRLIDTNIHGVHTYKPRPLEVYPTSIWKEMPARAADGEEILEYDEEEFLHLPEHLTAPENKAFEEGIAPTIQGDPGVWDYVSEEEYFGRKMTLLTDHRLLRLATKYTMKQLAEKINAATEVWEPDLVSEKTLQRRICERYIPRLAGAKGMTVAEIRKELKDARKVNGVGSQKRRSSVSMGSPHEQDAILDTGHVQDGEPKCSPTLRTKHKRVIPWLKDQAKTADEEEKQPSRKKSKTSLKPLTIPDTNKQDTTTSSATPSTATPSTGELGPIPDTDQAIFDSDPSRIVGASVYKLAVRYSVAEIQKRIVLAHPTSGIKSQHAKKELYKYVGQLAKESGKDRGAILDELNQARSEGRASKKGLKGGFAMRKRKAVEVEDEMPLYEGDAEALEVIDREMVASSVPLSTTPSTKTPRGGEFSPGKRNNIAVSLYTPTPRKSKIKSAGLRSPYFPKTTALPDTQIHNLVDDMVDYTTPKFQETARSYAAALALDGPALASREKSGGKERRIEILESPEEGVDVLIW
ncbi:uncharacterized protein MYCFIDRAFT_216038 [Pseudocercospora fijiensis CIRAD86]|uniref:Uncharacterized protein n=1 Tax=Pseudocercospora fijiensis (strain CIRAD86) TaxID=383855 RepID=M2ZLI0_PSEFD|nr:uncharacterized protein MYCFIDRAFT_216038 [Pseudocercospora fijiensis CIRAD86]EME79934.1 hypothetical protein MYCFIDRAFT_216038 [Pseudocercospora fijiensis CIRAD86]